MKPTGKLPVSKEQMFIVGEPNRCYETKAALVPVARLSEDAIYYRIQSRTKPLFKSLYGNALSDTFTLINGWLHFQFESTFAHRIKD